MTSNEPSTAQENRGIRPGVWLLTGLGVIAIGVIGFFARRSAERGESSAATPAIEAVATPPAKEARAEIQAVFKKYSQALLDGDGEAAFSVIDSYTTRSYAQMLRDALSLPARDLDRLGYVHKITVLRLRTEFRKPQLLQLTHRDLFVLAITNGWISKSTIQSIPEFQKVAVSGRYAQAYLPVAPKIPAFYFVYEDSQWKFALWKTFDLANAAFRQMKQESGLSEKEFLLTMLSKVSRFNVSEKIFEGPID